MAEIKYCTEHLMLSRKAASEGMVLLRNENNALPLSREKNVALFGRNQMELFKGGGGAADLWAVPYVSFADAMVREGKIYEPLLKKYRAYVEANLNRALNKVHFNLCPCTWALPEFPLKDAEVEEAAKACDTAVVFLGRFASEGLDIKDIAGEYRITREEEEMIKKVTARFEKRVLVFNLPGLFDISFLEKYNFDAIINAFMPGMEAGNALASVLYGDESPSGKLPDSWAATLEEYPTNDGFGTERIVYSEGIYMGYRYFDTFKKDVAFPFGFGLSYTNFEIDVVSATVEKTTVKIEAKVSNVGDYRGKETVQCYLSAPDGKLSQPYQILCGFEKTKTLKAGENCAVTIEVPLADFASYSEELAAYILEGGNYVLRIGNSSRNTKPACVINISETAVCRKVENRIVPEEAINHLKKEAADEDIPQNVTLINIDASAFETEVAPPFTAPEIIEKTVDCTFDDVLSGKNTAEELVACIPDHELAMLLTGDGYKKRQALGLEDKEVAAGEGTHTHMISELGIPSSVMQDGPAGVRASGFAYPIPPDDEIDGIECICYPSATMLAATWNKELLRQIGSAITVDMDRHGYNGLCAPCVNLHRNPLCGRNFEYFSEDPYLSAQMAIYMIRGIQENEDGTPTGNYAVIKHFACNNSEQERYVSDSILSERCARDIYLKAFEEAVKKCSPGAIMCSYNKVNGKYSSANSELVDGICRTEWGYKGWIMTDWEDWTTTVESLIAGADIVMPGEYVSYEEMLRLGLDHATMQKRAVNLISHLARTKHHR